MSFNQFSWNNYKQTKSFENFCLNFTPEKLFESNEYLDRELYFRQEYLQDSSKYTFVDSIEKAKKYFIFHIFSGDFISENNSFDFHISQNVFSSLRLEYSLDQKKITQLIDIYYEFYDGEDISKLNKSKIPIRLVRESSNKRLCQEGSIVEISLSESIKEIINKYFEIFDRNLFVNIPSNEKVIYEIEIDNRKSTIEEDIQTIDSFLERSEFLSLITDYELKCKKQKKEYGESADELIITSIPEISLALYSICPEYFVPYLFVPKASQNINNKKLDLNYNFLKKIFDEFDINLPEAPPRNKRFDKANYYNEINTVLYEFRIKHNLSAIELCAFLYDYAPQYLEENRDQELPTPLRVWLIKASHGSERDFEFIEKADETKKSRWNGNIKTKRGDILLMYCVSPRSFIHSIWRANSDGFTDPFFYYRNQIEICKKISIPQIGFKELQKSSVISQKNEMRANLQTPTGGIEFTYQEFEEIKELLKQKGFDTSILPKLPKSEISIEQNLLNERDVETKLLEPLLKELGYKSSDWIRQYVAQIGTRERIIPDYIFGLKNNKAKLIIETKFRYHDATQKEKDRHFRQARSYALHFQSPRLAIADKNGISLFDFFNNDFKIERNEFFGWNSLKKPNIFQELKTFCLA